jgi:hypothetical protein
MRMAVLLPLFASDDVLAVAATVERCLYDCHGHHSPMLLIHYICLHACICTYTGKAS